MVRESGNGVSAHRWGRGRANARSRQPHRSLAAIVSFTLVVTTLVTLGPIDPAHGSTFIVNSTLDRVDTNPGNGVCSASGGICTVRAAIQEANAFAGADTIQIPAGTYRITIPPVNDNLADNGDFDITDRVTITGAGKGLTILDAGPAPAGSPPQQRGIDRVIEVHPSSQNVTISSLTIRNGFSAESGGGIQFGPTLEVEIEGMPTFTGTLRLENLEIRDSYASKYGGGVNNVGRSLIQIVNSTLTGNGATEGGAAINNTSTGTIEILGGTVVEQNPGLVAPDPLDPESLILVDPSDYPLGAGAINNQAESDVIGTIRVADSFIRDNAAGGEGGAIANIRDGVIIVEGSHITGNSSEGNGGGIYSKSGRVTVTDSTISGNRAHNGGGIYGEGERTKADLPAVIELFNTTFDANTAVSNGGGVLVGGQTDVTLTDLTVTNNIAHAAGAGVVVEGRSGLDLLRGTFTGNLAAEDGGGLIVNAEGATTIRGSVFTDNHAGVVELTEEGLLGEADGAGGGLWTAGKGSVLVEDSNFTLNTAHGDGAGVSIHSFGTVTIRDSLIHDNDALGEEANGGGLENSGELVVLDRLTISNNTATGNGGGIHNSSSDEFTVLDTTIQGNRAENGGGFGNASDSTLVIRRTLILNNLAKIGPRDDTGLGGGFYSISDGGGIIENTTISGNTARVKGGGMYHDADAGLRVVNVTIWRNSAPFGGGIAIMESDAVPEIPPKAHKGLVLRNTIVAGSLQGGGCDGPVTSEGGNIDMGSVCFTYVPDSSAVVAIGDKMNLTPDLDAYADNGGQAMTHALTQYSIGVDTGVNTITNSAGTVLPACPLSDQRGVARPINGRCDTGAYEYEGPFPPDDLVAPETVFLGGPIQDTEATTAFFFTGTDDTTPPHELNFECRLLEFDPTEPPETNPPWEPVDPALAWLGCSSPYQTPVQESGQFTFEVRAIDRAGNVDPEPFAHDFDISDTSPAIVELVEYPPLETSSRTATFTFRGIDDVTPSQFLEYECRLDTNDPAMWLECLNPVTFSNLTTGAHTFSVRALDGAENIGPTTRYTWTVVNPTNCNEANIILVATADGWADQVNPGEAYPFESELAVRSDLNGATPGNARAFFRFNLPTATGGCTLERATLRLWGDGTEERTLVAQPLAASFSEGLLNWGNQPPVTGIPAQTVVDSGEGYIEWDVTTQVSSGQAGLGFRISDANESQANGGEATFLSREYPPDPPPVTLPVLVLRYATGMADPTAPPPPAAATVATPVHCGMVLTASTLLANGLTCPFGEGLVIGAPNIVVDLNGHTVTSGILLEPGEEDGLLAGIRNGSHKNVVIRNGRVENFGYGVRLMGGVTWNVVEDMTFVNNVLAGVELFDADDGRNGNLIQANTFMGNGDAVALFSGSENSTVLNNHMEGNLGFGVHIMESNGHRIEGNFISGVNPDPTLDSDGGINLVGASFNTIIDNTVNDSGDAALALAEGSHDNVIEANTFVRNGDAGISIQSSHRNSVIDNTAHLTSDAGLVLSSAHDTLVVGNDFRFNPGGIDVSSSNGVLIDDNDVTDALQSGIQVANSRGAVITNNVANLTGGSGISVEGGFFDAVGNPVDGALIQGNTTNQNSENGISADEGGHRVGTNNAHNNAAYGIDAALGSVDLGGNRATGNGRPEQCVGVFCTQTGAVALVPLDLEAPVTIIDEGPANPSPFSTAAFHFSGTDNQYPATALFFECRLDPAPDPVIPPGEIEPLGPPDPGDPTDAPDVIDPTDPESWTECVSPTYYHNVEAGPHRFDVRATDPIGNFDLSYETYEWTVIPEEEGTGLDSTPPTTRFIEVPANPNNVNPVTFRFSGSDNSTPGPNLTYECRLDSTLEEDFLPCASPHSLNPTVEEHTFEVRTVDFSGNVDVTPVMHLWTQETPPPDVTAPQTTITSGPDLVTVETDAEFVFIADESVASFECRLDTPTWSMCGPGPFSATGLTVGTHTFEVRSTDLAGNFDMSPAVHMWSVEAAPVATDAFCGQTVTQSIVLNNDLLECPVYGLVVGADSITIDLGGNTVDGIGGGIGIFNPGFASVTVKNGFVNEFDIAVQLDPGSTGNIVDGLTMELNQVAGVLLRNADSSIVRNSNMFIDEIGVMLAEGTQNALIHDNDFGGNTGEGVYLGEASGNRIENNLFGSSSGAGVLMVGSTGNTVVENRFLSNDGDGVVLQLGVPLVIVAEIPAEVEPPEPPELPDEFGSPANNNRIEANTFEEGGISIIGSSGNQVVGNEVQESEAGLYMYESHETLILNNNFSVNSAGISMYRSTGNRIEANHTSEIDGTGISLQDMSLDNELILNISDMNNGDGIYLGDQAVAGGGNVLDRNTTTSNGNNGISVSGTGHFIKGNIANNNTNWGIFAAVGSASLMNIDGGGNKALDNVQLEQCFGVICNGTGATSESIPPDTTILSGPSIVTTSDSATFRFTGTDNVSSVNFQCRLDSVLETDFTLCSSPRTLTGLSVGGHTFEVRAIDMVGNIDSTPAIHTWTVNLPPPGFAPDTTIDSGPDLTTVDPSAAFTFSASEPGSIFECRLDSVLEVDFTACSSPAQFGPLAVGTHTFEVRAIDIELLVDATPAIYTWTIGAAPVPTAVSCGQLITVSIVVTNDLFDCAGDGLVVFADGITIDLDGHTISGTGLGAGILNPRFDSVTITNGIVQGFEVGIALNPGSQRNVLSDLTVRLNTEAGMQLSDADNAVIRHNTVGGNSFGIALYSGSREAHILNNVLDGNAAESIWLDGAGSNVIENNTVRMTGGAGIALSGASDNVIVGNTLASNDGGAISMILASHRNEIRANAISASGGEGIIIDGSNSALIIDNVIQGSNGAALVMTISHNNLVQANDFRGNASGVEMEESSGNRIEANNISGGGGGIALGALSLNNVIVLNTASANLGEGISIEDLAPAGQGNVIDRNVVNSNAGDGIFVGQGGHTITGNVANFNGGWGIYAEPGSTDGGDNRAAGNVEPEQCFGIVCEITEVPGAPTVEILTGPPAISSSSVASFTYTGFDDTTPQMLLGFECRLDSTDPLAFEECEYPQVYTGLTPGTHTFYLRALDEFELASPIASYTWTYNPLPSGVAPDTTILLSPGLQSTLFEAIFTFESNEPDATFECNIDNTGWVGCGLEEGVILPYSFYVVALEETQVGVHTFAVRAVDLEGLVDPTPAVHTWTISGGPITTILSGPGFIPPEAPGEPPTGGEVEGSTATFTFVSENEPESTYLCALDLEPFVPCDNPASPGSDLRTVTYTGLAMGAHMFRVFATSPEGAEEIEPMAYEWEIIPPLFDLEAPNTFIVSGPTDGSSEAVFEFTGSDNVTLPILLTFECGLDNPNPLLFVECVSPFDIRDLVPAGELSPGVHTLYVIAVDEAEPDGNRDSTPASYTWSYAVDTVAPETTLNTTPPTEVGIDTPALFTFSGADNVAPGPLSPLVFECSLDAEPFAECESPVELSGLGAGSHTFQVRAIDASLNADSTPASFTFTVFGPPVTTLTETPEVVTSETIAMFEFEADQSGATFECALNGSDFLPCVSPFVIDDLFTDGWLFEVQAINAFGVVEDSPAAFSWTVNAPLDTTPPDTTILSGPVTSTLSLSATFTFESSQGFSTFECALDGGIFSSCESPLEYENVGPGTHTFEVRAIDSSGNVDPTPASHTWTIDGPPVVEILLGPDEVTMDTAATFTFVVSDPGSTFQCWLDGVITACTSPVTYTGLSRGAHLFAVLATDPAGNTGTQWEDYEWSVIAGVTIDSGPSNPTTSREATFEFTGNVPGLAIFCALDEAEFGLCMSPRTYTDLAGGSHVFSIQVVDPLVDADPVPLVYNWTITDVTAPDTFIDFGPDPVTDSTTASFFFSADEPGVIFECSLDGEAFSECELPALYEDLPLGPHTLSVRAVDAVPLVDPTPAVYQWEIVPDTTPPDTSIIFGPPATTGSLISLFIFSGTDTGTIFEDLVYECSLDGFAFAECENPLELELLSSGEHTLRVRAVDLAGNFDLTPATRTWNVILITPTGFGVVVEIGMPGGLELEPAALTFTQVTTSGVTSITTLTTVPEPLPTGYLQLGALYYDVSTTALYNGPVMVCLSFDPAGFADPGSVHLLHYEGGAWVDVTAEVDPSGVVCGEVSSLSPFAIAGIDPDVPPVDGPPDTTITAGPPALTSNFEVIFQFTGQDNQTPSLDLGFECSLDGGPFESCSTPHEVVVLIGGDHTFEVRAVDSAGQADPSPAAFLWTVIDLTAPETSIDLGPESETTEASATFEFSADDPLATFDCSLDGADFESCASPHQVTGLLTGLHTMRVRAVDPLGNADPTPELYEWLVTGPVDITAPDTFFVTITTLIEEGTTTYLLSFTASEAGVEFECSLDGSAFEGCGSPAEYTDLTAGNHAFEVRAIDLAGNVDLTPAVHVFNVAAAATPETTVTAGPADPSGAASVLFEFTSDIAGSTFLCSINGSEFTGCTSPHLTQVIEEGEQVFEVQARSPQNVLDPTPATYTWEYGLAPETTLVSTELTTVELSPVYRFFFTGADDHTPIADLAFECALDGGAFEGCSSPHDVELTELTPGDHTFEVRAVDDAGHFDSTPATFDFSTLPAPDTTVISGPDAQTESTEATFTFSSDNPAATFECSLDLGVFTACSSGVAVTGLGFGPHEFVVRAVANGLTDPDPAIYEWEVGDLTPPITTILSGPAASTSDSTASFTFGAGEPGLTFQCSLDGGLPQFCASPAEYTGLVAGLHTFQVVPVGIQFLVEPEAALYEWTVVDGVAPETTILSGPPASTLTTEATFTFSGSDNDTPVADLEFECSLDGAAYEPCTSPHTETDLGVADHTFEVRAIDSALNADATTAIHTWTVELDEVNPDTTITSGPSGVMSVADVEFVFTGSDNHSAVLDLEYECSLNGSTFEPCGSPEQFSGLAEGENTFEVKAIDEVGNVDDTPASRTWSIDLAPDTAITSAPPALDESNDAAFEFSSTDAGSSFECALDGAAFAACVSPVNLTDVSAGPHTFSVRAIDSAGTPDPEPASHSWTVLSDSTPPETSIVSGPTGSTTFTNATFTFSANELGATFECSLDGSAFTSCSSPQAYTGLAGGSHTFSVRATDLANNVDATPASRTWTVDQPPDTTITSGPEASTVSTSATIEFTSSEVGSTFECSLDGAGFSTCTSPVMYAGLALGDHEVQVYAIDPAGNPDLSPDDYEWTVVAADTTPPDTSITGGPSGLVTSADAELSFTGSDNHSSVLDLEYECSLNDSTFEPCGSPEQLSGLAEGVNTFEVRAVDEAGNVDSTPASRSWTVDTIDPVTTIDSGPLDSTSTSATISFSANEAVTGFECSLDEAAYAACTSPVTLTGLSVGPHTFTVRATDLAGNVEGTPVHNWNVLDSTAPVTTINTDPGASTESGSASFGFSANEAGSTFECSLDGVAYETCTSPTSYTGLALGSHSFSVKATDAAGNAGSPDTHAWTVVDVSAPQTTIGDSPAASTTSTSATFSFTANEAGSTFECSLDGAAYGPCTTPVSYTGLAMGIHTFSVRATDGSGNTDASPAGHNWTVNAPPDTTAPETSFSATPPAATTSTSAGFAFASSESGSTFQCKLDAAAFAACSSPVTLTGLSVGSHTYQVRATDAAGNQDTSSASFTWTVNNLPPSCGSTVNVTANADAWINQGSTSENKGDDSNLKVMSKSGNALRALVRFPMPTIPAGCVVQSATLTLYAGGSSSGRTLQALRLAATWTEMGVNWSNQPATAGTAATTTSGSGNRNWDVKAQVQAMYDNNALHGFLIRDAVETNDNEQQFYSREKGENPPRLVVAFGPPAAPDTTPPETSSVSGGPSDPTTSTSATFNLGGTDNVTSGYNLGYQCSIDGSGFTLCTSPVTYNGLVVGPHTFSVRAVDAAGNVDLTPVTYGWTIVPPPPDATAPETTIASGPAATTTDTDAVFVFSASEAATFQCSIDGGATAACSSPLNFSGLAIGGHTVSVVATDLAGNVDPSPATHAWTVEPAPSCVGGSVTAGAVADSWVNQDSKSKNYGNDSSLKLDASSNKNNRVFVRFNLPVIPEGCEVVSATLRLYAASYKNNRTLQAFSVASAWTESGINWNNQPATTGAATTAPSGSGWREWNVASQVGSMYTGANHGFMIRDSANSGSNSDQQFNSREKGTDRPPELVIVFG